MIVDSNVWADFFNGEPGPHVARLERALREEEDLGILPIILTEVLQGFRTDTGFQRALRLLLPLPAIEPNVETHVSAARLFRALRRRGVTVRGAVDCVIAQTCIDTDSELISPDADFARIARVVPLRLWRPEV